MFFQSERKPTALIILDGWGVAPSWGGNAISQAKTANFDKILKTCPNTTLLASGPAVGQPPNSPGNSEVGHLNIGAGRIVREDLSLIDQKIEDKSFFVNPIILAGIDHAKKFRSNIHLLGLLSKTGTHSHIRHLYALLSAIKEKSFDRVYIHLFSDGRDSEPMSGIEMAEEVALKTKEIGLGRVVSLCGRFYAMDRDHRWERIARAYALLTRGEGQAVDSLRLAFTSAYTQGTTDEFIEPRVIINKTQNKTVISDNDCVIFFNFRSDRARELTQAFLDNELPNISNRQKIKNLFFATFVIYDEHVLAKKIFSPEKISSPLPSVWSKQGLSQFHLAETEKYPHVTYFFNGGVEKPFPKEKRLMIPSPRQYKTYDLIPKMSAEKLTAELVRLIKNRSFDCFVVNFANPDMVGHSGNLAAAVLAIEYVDLCLGQVLAAVLKNNGTAFVTADHGNAEQMVNPQTGEPDTEHTTNPVPFIIVSANPEIKKAKLQNDGILANIAPTILDLSGIEKPLEMKNHSLIIRDIIKTE